ncbi:AMP-dependent synthetase/ligase [Penicillium bovifimosum]|uniref:AMP-dependent synthetase/ligase n=1 Tax=Penicillium bovifimosum TaxID=126998 RepID=A0A9W9HAX5_9EURO|nr:AMP-dependent synthetase/ligase [Penicillium bovifimosum]KAJ5143307.1 AMP-dependent synthetase/ligase [Penicillium bovifimosum]
MAPVLLEPAIEDPQTDIISLKATADATPLANGVDLVLRERPWKLLHLVDALDPSSADRCEHPDIQIQRLLQLAWVATVRAFSTSTTLYIGQDYAKGRCYVGEAAHDSSMPTAQLHTDPHDTVKDLFSQSIEALGSLGDVKLVANGYAGKKNETSRFNVTIVYQKQRILSGESPCEGLCQTCCGVLASQPSEPDSVFTGLRLSIQHTLNERLRARLDVGDTGLELPVATSLLHSFNEALTSINGSHTQTIGSLDLCSAQDREQIAQFTASIAPAQDALLHELCLQHVQTTPDAPAVRSWDGDLTYRQLEDLTTRLAHWLVNQGVGPNVFVACAFYKSTWAIVARLAILMAGGAYICVDGNDPPPYLGSVLERSKMKIMLTSSGYHSRFADLVETIFEVSEASVSTLPYLPSPPCTTVKPTDPCVVLFTSGSTGKPKGIVQEHRSYASALTDYIRVMRMGPHSRMFQFDAYAFDISNNDFLAPLIAGGCCCVPTVSLTMNSLMEDVNTLEGNIMFITPSVAIDMDPDRVPTLKTICIGGEPVSDAVLAKWLHRVEVINQYGMGEVASLCAYNRDLDLGRGSIVGRAASGAIWIVNRDNTDQLMPVGAVGELLIEGPHLSRGYLDHISGKSENFLSDPPVWMAQIHTDRPKHRLYRSGDLGRYNHDGTIELMGRKDSMLKLDGARVEAGQVEYVLRSNLSTGDVAVVDILGAIDGGGDPILAVYLYLAGNPLNVEGGNVEEMSFWPVWERHAVRKLTSGEETLPKYYEPSLYLVVDRVPRTRSKKIDRRKLHLLGQEYYLAHREELDDVLVKVEWDFM